MSVDVVFKDVFDLLDGHDLVLALIWNSTRTVLLFELNHTVHDK